MTRTLAIRCYYAFTTEESSINGDWAELGSWQGPGRFYPHGPNFPEEDPGEADKYDDTTGDSLEGTPELHIERTIARDLLGNEFRVEEGCDWLIMSLDQVDCLNLKTAAGEDVNGGEVTCHPDNFEYSDLSWKIIKHLVKEGDAEADIDPLILVSMAEV